MQYQHFPKLIALTLVVPDHPEVVPGLQLPVESHPEVMPRPLHLLLPPRRPAREDHPLAHGGRQVAGPGLVLVAVSRLPPRAGGAGMERGVHVFVFIKNMFS